MTNFEHFAPDVPRATMEKMQTLAALVQDEIINYAPDGYGMAQTDTISGRAYSGFVPYQQGGYSVMEYYALQPGSGRYFTPGHETAADAQAQDARREWLRQEGLDEVPDEREEEFYNFESEWLQDRDALLTCEIWTGHNQDAAPGMVTVRLAINYRDAPYFRGKYAEDLLEMSYTAEEFAMLDLADCIKALQGVL